MPAASRSTVSSRMASATWLAVSASGWSSRTNDHARIVTGPVSMPLTGCCVSDCAYVVQSTVIGCGRRTSPYRIGGRTQRVPYDCTQPWSVAKNPSSCSAKYCTMSLRSGSPCTSTSRPSLLQRDHIGDLGAHPASGTRPRRSRPCARAARATRICVGLRERADRRGRQHRKRQRRLGFADVPPRDCAPDPDAVSASSRARTVASCSRGSALRVDAAASGARELVVDGFATARSARSPSATTSRDLLGAERQPATAAPCRCRSPRRACTGTCSSEHDVETASEPVLPSRVPSDARAASRSVRQMLRPSTTPATTCLRVRSGTVARGSDPATRSIAIPSTPVDAIAGSASTEAAEVGRDEDRRSRLQRGQPVVGPLGRRDLRRCAVGDERRLVDLHPVGARVGEPTEQVRIQRDEFVEAVEEAVHPSRQPSTAAGT